MVVWLWILETKAVTAVGVAERGLGVVTALYSSGTHQESVYSNWRGTQSRYFNMIHPILAIFSLIGICGFKELVVHMSCGYMNRAATIHLHLELSIPWLLNTQFLFFGMLSPIAGYSYVRPSYYRVIQEMLNLPFPVLLMNRNSSET